MDDSFFELWQLIPKPLTQAAEDAKGSNMKTPSRCDHCPGMSSEYIKIVDGVKELFVWSPRDGVEIEVYDPELDCCGKGSTSIVIPTDKVPAFIDAVKHAVRAR